MHRINSKTFDTTVYGLTHPNVSMLYQSYFCIECKCNIKGTVNYSNDCNNLDCRSKPGCKPGYKGMLCDACESAFIEKIDNIGKVNCVCESGYSGDQCDKCASGYYGQRCTGNLIIN